jgi:hypothetical protein
MVINIFAKNTNQILFQYKQNLGDKINNLLSYDRNISKYKNLLKYDQISIAFFKLVNIYI